MEDNTSLVFGPPNNWEKSHLLAGKDNTSVLCTCLTILTVSWDVAIWFQIYSLHSTIVNDIKRGQRQDNNVLESLWNELTWHQLTINTEQLIYLRYEIRVPVINAIRIKINRTTLTPPPSEQKYSIQHQYPILYPLGATWALHYLAMTNPKIQPVILA